MTSPAEVDDRLVILTALDVHMDTLRHHLKSGQVPPHDEDTMRDRIARIQAAKDRFYVSAYARRNGPRK